MSRGRQIIWLVVGIFLAFSGTAFAQKDKEGCHDHPMLTRMQNFYIDHCEKREFDEVDFRDEEGNTIRVEGKVYRLDYNIKEGFTPPSSLQVIKNYEAAIENIGGIKIYQEESYEIWLKLDKNGKTFWVYVDSWHGGGKGETYGITIVEKEAMVQEVVADAKSMMSYIQAKGSASVYGIYFDFDKAEIKPESEPAIKEIAKLLQENTELKLYVVGHTDNVGNIEYNMKLSKARADAVMKELVTKYKVSAQRLKAFGVGSLAPVASNKSDDGRAKNRRVELVEQ
ncbi:OmpA family protein [Desulfosoma caldarium]|uniref:OmpA family protein n=1 Tax=Desulfosoma caldarium TaxID=610254 RepID=A0A3N1UR23_9BACT|nr:OmpA family protein [Desulfosoma caldarium]ROQ92198.1 OmpA family protein [Desulfosoma caldarium]